MKKEDIHWSVNLWKDKNNHYNCKLLVNNSFEWDWIMSNKLYLILDEIKLRIKEFYKTKYYNKL